MDHNYRLVSRVCPETGSKEYGIERDTYGWKTFLGGQPNYKMCFLCKVCWDSSKFIVSHSRHGDHWVNWWHNRGEVEIAMEKYLDQQIKYESQKEKKKKFQQAAEEHGVKVERYF